MLLNEVKNYQSVGIFGKGKESNVKKTVSLGFHKEKLLHQFALPSIYLVAYFLLYYLKEVVY